MNPSNMMKQPKHAQPQYNLRAHIVQVLVNVQQGQSLASLLPSQLKLVAERDRALFHELLLGTLRQWHGLKAISLPLIQNPIDQPVVETCLALGLYQILFTRIAPHAAISETVDACKQMGFVGLSGMVNAILRSASRDIPDFQTRLNAAHGLPSWLYKRLKKDWPEQLADLCQQLKHSAPLTLRVNTRQISRDEYLSELHEDGVAATACLHSADGIVLQQSVHIPSLYGFAEGAFSVQDEHAQLCASLVPNLDGLMVLDACAAPGGKTAHLLEHFAPRQLIALDQDAQRLVRLQENLERLRLNAAHLDVDVQVICADATSWQAPEPLDVIVLDAPCSATGVIRRHPDIRLLRQSSDIAQTVALQAAILDHLWSQLKVGGQLLYITCSILKAENEQQIAAFLSRTPDAVEVPIAADWGIAQTHGRQLLPQVGSGDGFYFARLRKV